MVKPLSKRQKDIARLLAKGYIDKEIACELRISEHTVKNIFVKMMDKKGLVRRTRTALLVALIIDGDIKITTAANMK